MALPDIIISLCLLSVGGLIVGSGLLYLDRQDRRQVEAARQRCCRWHHWQASEEGQWLVCRLCGKRSLRFNPHEDRVHETLPFFP